MRAAAPAIVRLGAVASTQAIAFDLAREGAADGTVVMADTQTAGRGRQGRRWEDESGASLLVSILVRPRLPVHQLPLLSFVAALAVADMLHETAGLIVRLKWPNDVVVAERKIAGILLESRLGGPESPAPILVIGIGVNLAQRTFAAALANRATSVVLETGSSLERDVALAALVRALGAWRGRLERSGFEPIRERWLALSDTIGRRVRVDGVAGQAIDLDRDGALVLADGATTRRIVAGAVDD